MHWGSGRVLGRTKESLYIKANIILAVYCNKLVHWGSGRVLGRTKESLYIKANIILAVYCNKLVHWGSGRVFGRTKKRLYTKIFTQRSPIKIRRVCLWQRFLPCQCPNSTAPGDRTLKARFVVDFPVAEEWKLDFSVSDDNCFQLFSILLQ